MKLLYAALLGLVVGCVTATLQLINEKNALWSLGVGLSAPILAILIVKRLQA